MIETVRLIGDLGSRVGDLRELNRRTLDWRRVGAPGGSRWVALDTPEGVGSVSIVTQGKSCRWEAEGNLTSCLHGENSTAGSLRADEVAPAVGVLVERAMAATLGAPTPRDRDLRFNRVDYSRSLVLPAEVKTAGVLLGCLPTAMKNRSDAHPVNLIGSGGVTLALGKRGSSRYWRFYEKTSEALRAGKPCPPNTLRLESERKTTGGECRYLEEVPEMVYDADSEIADMARWLVESCANYNLATVAMLRQGMVALGQKDDSAEAMRLSGASSVLAVYGVAGLMEQAGVSRATAFRMKSRIHDLIVAAYGSQPEDVLRGAIETARVLLADDLDEDGHPRATP